MQFLCRFTRVGTFVVASVTSTRQILYFELLRNALSERRCTDPRFLPLTLNELSVVDFEISVLSSMKTVRDIAEIEVGKHGLLISKNHSRGLLLPQVAATYDWGRERFLDETCKKAGLRSGDWREGRDHSIFQRIDIF